MADEKIISVSELNYKVEQYVAKNFHISTVWIKGECSNVKYYPSGHIYFSLKDEEAQILCVMFKTYAERLSFRLENGKKILVNADASFYARDGRFQLKVMKAKEEGLGDVYERFLALKQAFTEKGYFDEKHKKPLPFLPKRLGVVTSASGAVIRDIINVSTRRFPSCNILLYPSAVQGPEAAKELVAGIKALDARPDIDVIIIGRGGGSMEDLWCFNDKDLVEAIFHCQTPVVSAVGHETDFTLCDYVADLRAPTPSAAAENVWPLYSSIELYLKNSQKNLSTSLERLYEKKTLYLGRSQDSLQRRIQNISQKAKNRYYSCVNILNKKRPDLILEQHKLNIRHHLFMLHNSTKSFLDKKAAEYKEKLIAFAAFSPEDTFRRGYSISRKDNKIIKSIENVAINDLLTINLLDGDIKCRVENIIQKEMRQ